MCGPYDEGRSALFSNSFKLGLNLTLLPPWPTAYTSQHQKVHEADHTPTNRQETESLRMMDNTPWCNSSPSLDFLTWKKSLLYLSLFTSAKARGFYNSIPWLYLSFNLVIAEL